MIPPNFPETVAASGSESAGLPRGGPWGLPEHIPARTAAPALRAGPRPAPQLQARRGPEGARGRGAAGRGRRQAPRHRTATRGRRARRPGLGPRRAADADALAAHSRTPA